MNNRPTPGARPNANRSKPDRNGPRGNASRSAGSNPNSYNKNAPHSQTRTRPAPNPQIIRQARFAGKLHRGSVADESTGEVCAIKRECGACVFVNTDYATGLRRKFDDGLKLLRENGVLQTAQVIDPIPSPNTEGYRSLFKLAVRPAPYTDPRRLRAGENPRRFAIGLFEPGTHRVSVNMTGCPIHVKPLTWLLEDLEVELELTGLQPWNEQRNTGDLRYVVARAAHLTGEIMITWVVTKPVKAELLKITQKLRRLGHKIHSAFMNINASSGNAIFGPEIVSVAGGNGLRETVCELNLEISPLAFFQVNPWQANNLYRRVELHAGKARGGSVAWDLYTGTGQIGLILARSGFRTIGVEEVPEATQDARQNAIRNNLEDKIEFIASRVEDSETKLPEWSQKPNVIVVNPSRRGLHETARSHLAHVLRNNPDCKFIYVSCEASTMARDLAALTATGHRVRQIEAFDMFAQTDKLEWLAVLTR